MNPSEPDLANHGGEDEPVEGIEMARPRRAADPNYPDRVDSTSYSWEELVDYARQGYDIELNWRFAHLTAEQKGAMAREARKKAA